MMRRRGALLVAALGLSAVMAACGGGSDSDSADTTEGTTASTVAAGEDTVSVNLAEYTYGVSGSLRAGGTIRLQNLGREFHMMGLGKLKEGKTLDDLKTVLEKASGPPASPEEDPTKDIIDEVGVPGAIIGPGQTAEVTVPTLSTGTYAMVCFIPVEGGGPPHFTKGMISQLSVVDGKPPVPKADATFTIAPGKPVQGPSSLKAGKHVIEFKAEPGSEQLEPGIAKLDPGKTIKDVNAVFKSFESGDDFILPVGAPSKVPAKLAAGFFDMRDVTSVFVGLDLTPGTYGIDAHDSDVKDAPIDPVEKATFAVT
jgi:uncharacterized cupredoxin-like copper-binding protein